MFAKVIVDIKLEIVNKEFDYIVPNQFETFLERGMRVIVDFNNQKRLGYVLSIHEHSNEAKKEILEILDTIPTVDDELFLILDELMKKSPMVLSQAFETIIPNELLVNYNKKVILKNKELCPSHLIPLFNKNNELNLKKKDQFIYKELKKLALKDILEIKTIIKEKGSSKVKTYLSLNQEHHYQKVSKYQDIIDLFKIKNEYLKPEIIELGFKVSQIDTLIKNSVLIKTIKKVFDINDSKKLSATNINLSQGLNSTFDLLDINENNVYLVKSKNNSNKNHLFIKYIDKIIKSNKKVLYLLPETSMVDHLYDELGKYFDRISKFHSQMTKGDRLNQYEKIITDNSDVIIGTRSSVFLPIKDLSLIIIDEEHNDSFIQKEGIYYNAKELALFRAKYHHIPIILSSNTPSVLSYYMAKQGIYKFIELEDNLNHNDKPRVNLVDMRIELKNKNTTILAHSFKEAIQNRIKNNEKTLIMVNKKGYSNFVLCLNCGEVPKCIHCDLSLSYYKSTNTLKCNLCGYEEPFIKKCNVCQDTKIKEIGTGIEYIEEKLKIELPTAKILKINKSKDLNNEFLDDYDILLGTEMIIKTNTYDQHTLAGVLMVDSMLKVPSYQASENTYLTIKDLEKKLIQDNKSELYVQGYDISHYAIKSLSSDYETFYNEAIYHRKLNEYLPFKNVSIILFQGISYLKTYQKAFEFKKVLLSLNIKVIGPSEDMLKRAKDLYRFIITIKYEEIDLEKIFDYIKKENTDSIKIKFIPNIDLSR